ncbi:MAG: carbohydrate ABC transporter permease [Meiothermus sp.]|uniref:carbohydrate ABC transporter permease n=1 Tax=Meiothermus sp. TaxID=1955249 RepID=UPI0025F92467|nr:carbohydrate ABC transporter permease [Meiothermus sp.]MCS7057494.1 carbohydrate ABC transporter permease [Meiothermus sp.]MCS7195046.1 carbohydrate ABC transporter permease [Meiothermus sp.]MCX7739584.1 carbohydrate ABC transporter permease [Meiothermus sp.]MDW8090846.1 carbohydrate ABC transporter permease [Meiothermus sp.]MDW8482459.1 carbohydrate ABC transporter permease [Meiothermus sp.]
MRRNRSPLAPSPLQVGLSYLALGLASLFVLFPLYWLLITSFKLPIDVNSGPFYLPWLDFKPSLHAWEYVLGTLGPDVRRAYANTAVVALSSALLALFLGASAAYALTRFQYRPRVGAVVLFVACLGFVVLMAALGVPWQVAVGLGLAVFILGLQTLGRRFRRHLSNDDIALWLISNRILPPVVVVIPIYLLFQQLGLLDTRTALVISYTVINVPIAVWLMRDYFQNIPPDIEECAQIDGASRYRIFWTIVLPLAAPGLVATFLLLLVFAWNEYLLALFLSKANSQTMPLMVAAMSGTRGTEWWYMSVIIILMILPVVLLALVLERYIERGLIVGAVKG